MEILVVLMFSTETRVLASASSRVRVGSRDDVKSTSIEQITRITSKLSQVPPGNPQEGFFHRIMPSLFHLDILSFVHSLMAK